MVGKPPAVDVIRLFTKQIEHLRKGKSNDKVVGAVRIGNAEEQRRFFVPELVKL